MSAWVVLGAHHRSPIQLGARTNPQERNPLGKSSSLEGRRCCNHPFNGHSSYPWIYEDNITSSELMGRVFLYPFLLVVFRRAIWESNFSSSRHESMPFGVNGKINRGRLVAVAENKHKSGKVRQAGSCSWAGLGS